MGSLFLGPPNPGSSPLWLTIFRNTLLQTLITDPHSLYDHGDSGATACLACQVGSCHIFEDRIARARAPASPIPIILFYARVLDLTRREILAQCSANAHNHTGIALLASTIRVVFSAVTVHTPNAPGCMNQS